MKSIYKKIILVYALSICFYVITIILFPFLLEQIEYLIVPKIVYKISFVFGVILFLYSMINIDSKVIQFFQRELKNYTNDEQDNLKSELVEISKPLNPLRSKLLRYDKYTLPMWSIWLFLEAFCFVVCAFTIISAGTIQISKDKATLAAGDKKQKSFLCVTEDIHQPNGDITSMINYQYDANGILIRKIYYDAEGKIEKYVDYIYNKKSYLISTEVYRPVADSRLKQEFYHDTSDLNNKMYEYNDDGICIFERSGLNSERRFSYLYDKKGRVSEIGCALNNELEYYQINDYRLDGNIKKEKKADKGKYITLFNKWAILINPIVTHYIYDNRGNLIKIEYGDGTTTDYIYDEYNNVVRKEVLVNGIKTYYIVYTYDLYESTNH